MSSNMMRDRFAGCMVGSLIGDALGDPFENEHDAVPVSISKIVELFNQLSDKAKKHYTDDTEMTKALAESLIAKNGYDYVDCCQRYAAEYFAPKDYNPNYGGNVHRVFRMWKQAYPDFDVLEPARQQFNGGGSCGNGSSMRVSPVALFCYKGNVEQAISIAKETSLLTHTHPNGFNGAVLQCLAVYYSLQLPHDSVVDVQAFVDTLLKHMKEVEDKCSKDIDKPYPYCKKLMAMKGLLEKPTGVPEQEVIDVLGNGILAVDAVPIAIFAFLQAISKDIPSIKTQNKFEKIIQYAISLGGDTDTIACMTGAIAGAFLGQSSIPERLQNGCRGIENAVERGNKLYDLVSVRNTAR